MEMRYVDSVDLKRNRGPIVLMCSPGFEVIIERSIEPQLRKVSYKKIGSSTCIESYIPEEKLNGIHVGYFSRPPFLSFDIDITSIYVQANQ